MKRNFYHKRRRFGPEKLETRQLLAGDVTVSTVNDHWFLIGDIDDNAIVITSTGNPGEIVLSSDPTNPTLINGGAGPVTLSGINGPLVINVGDGDDRVTLDSTAANITLVSDLIITTGDGNDTIRFQGSVSISVGDELMIHSHDGDDEVSLANTFANHLSLSLEDGNDRASLQSGSINGDLGASGGNGDDSISISMSVTGDVQVGGDEGSDHYTLGQNGMHIGGTVFGFSAESLSLLSCEVDGNFIVEGTANVVIARARIDGHVMASFERGSSFGAGFDAANPQFSHIGGNFVVTSRYGDVSLGLQYLNVGRDLVFRGGVESEDVRLNNVRAGNSLLIDTGGGNDVVWVHNSSARGEAAILAGAGSDYVRMGNFLGARSLFVDTAAGFDLVSVSYTSTVQNLYVWLGGDSDQATVSAASARFLAVDAGAGFDAVRVEYSAADHLFAGMGEGNDSLAVVGSLARRSAFLDGGAGRDLLSLRGNLLSGLTRQNFEAVGA
jgi:hypothetical protein